jgi:hypothetical protein
MSAVVDLAVNVVSLVIVMWMAVLFYFSVEEYNLGGPCFVSKNSVTKANKLFMDQYEKIKNKAKTVSLPTLPAPSSSFGNYVEHFEERELNPHTFDYDSGAVSTEKESEVVEDEDYNDVLVSQLEPIVVEQHNQYVKNSNRTTSGASTKVERSDREDVVPQWGLRRVKYGKDMLSKNALSVPSFEYEDEKTTRTNLMDIIGGSTY